jgi:hypothetical protein
MQPHSDVATQLLDDALSLLEHELHQARISRDEVETEYQARIEPLNSRVRALEAAVNHQRGALETYGGRRNVTAPTGESEKLTDAAHRILAAAGEPMHYRRLAEQLVAEGASLSGKDTGTTLINYLRREPERFCRTATAGNYALVEWNLADAKPVVGERKAPATKKRTVRTKAGGKKATPKRRTRRTTK